MHAYTPHLLLFSGWVAYHVKNVTMAIGHCSISAYNLALIDEIAIHSLMVTAKPPKNISHMHQLSWQLIVYSNYSIRECKLRTF
jgi:hypothetical protein